MRHGWLFDAEGPSLTQSSTAAYLPAEPLARGVFIPPSKNSSSHGFRWSDLARRLNNLSLTVLLSRAYPIGLIAGTTSSSETFILLAKFARLKVPPNQQVPRPRPVAASITFSKQYPRSSIAHGLPLTAPTTYRFAPLINP